MRYADSAEAAWNVMMPEDRAGDRQVVGPGLPGGVQSLCLSGRLLGRSSGNAVVMSFLSNVKRMRAERIEQRRAEAMLAAVARGATPEQVQRAGERAAWGNTNAAIAGSVAAGVSSINT
ncbi:hypothetical protein [Streptomyces sp. GS7]|uniref:hypothetical protein n=1 Tax=Streptomyces sp. GS7 TaxID=2692234 RepID=UPI001318D2E8|nr:hypothetical protein [Streptomyces sp. GS7]QHC23176.1 hypothetical protein GR130_18920 [Streptomyces sp. GS7]